jgi:hypothetical protein
MPTQGDAACWEIWQLDGRHIMDAANHHSAAENMWSKLNHQFMTINNHTMVTTNGYRAEI